MKTNILFKIPRNYRYEDDAPPQCYIDEICMAIKQFLESKTHEKYSIRIEENEYCDFCIIESTEAKPRVGMLVDGSIDLDEYCIGDNCYTDIESVNQLLKRVFEYIEECLS